VSQLIRLGQGGSGMSAVEGEQEEAEPMATLAEPAVEPEESVALVP
jgi:hypothetical protein